MKPETVTFTSTKVVPIADADGKPICEGSIIQEINDQDRGVVVRIIRATDTEAPMMAAVGDMMIRKRPGVTRVTNRYNQWRHVPHERQTHEERYLSWLHTPSDRDALYESDSISKDTSAAIFGISGLLPEDAVDWDNNYPYRLEDILHYLAVYVDKLKEDKNEPKEVKVLGFQLRIDPSLDPNVAFIGDPERPSEMLKLVFKKP